MPFGPLLKRLQEKTSGRILRADNGVSVTWPAVKEARYQENDEYVDYMIDL
jgi:hypothetical protein